MKILSTLAGAAWCAVAAAQGPLVCNPTPATYYGWNTPPPISTMLFNLTVTAPVTLQALTVPVSNPVGTQGQLQFWLTNAGITTYVGSETVAGNWTQAASGILVGAGTTGTLASMTVTSCQQVGGGGLLLVPGTYGAMLRFVGINPWLPAVTTVQTFTNAELSVTGGALQYTPFTAPVGPPPGFVAWQPRMTIAYQNGVFPHACAESEKYGAGCNTVSGSTAQEWTDSTPGGAAVAAGTALTGRRLAWIPSASGYVLVPSTATFITPSGTAAALPANDDGETAITPTQAFTYPGGVATQLFVHSNGYVSVASNNTLPGGPNWLPEISSLLSANATAWWAWHDHNPAEPGSGLIVWEEVGTVIVITFNDVESYPATAVNRSTVQFQFDTATGIATMLFQTIAAGGSGFLQGDDWVVGSSWGGPSPGAIPLNVTTLTTINLPQPEVFPLDLNTSSKPLLGTTVNLVTSQQQPLSIGVNFVSTIAIPAPGFDLGIIGMPGCVALLDINAGVGNVISDLGLPGLSMSIAFPLPLNPTLAGLQIASQSVWLFTGVNPAGIITSPGILLTLGNF
ncbi:MAG: hypothetical protein WAT39_20440 [Planctomycetota bacterium]